MGFVEGGCVGFLRGCWWRVSGRISQRRGEVEVGGSMSAVDSMSARAAVRRERRVGTSLGSREAVIGLREVVHVEERVLMFDEGRREDTALPEGIAV